MDSDVEIKVDHLFDMGSEDDPDMIWLSLKGTDVCLFNLILYVPSTIFELNRDGSFWVEPVLS